MADEPVTIRLTVGKYGHNLRIALCAGKQFAKIFHSRWSGSIRLICPDVADFHSVFGM
jgi:hypothetical protein